MNSLTFCTCLLSDSRRDRRAASSSDSQSTLAKKHKKSKAKKAHESTHAEPGLTPSNSMPVTLIEHTDLEHTHTRSDSDEEPKSPRTSAQRKKFVQYSNYTQSKKQRSSKTSKTMMLATTRIRAKSHGAPTPKRKFKTARKMGKGKRSRAQDLVDVARRHAALFGTCTGHRHAQLAGRRRGGAQ